MGQGVREPVFRIAWNARPKAHCRPARPARGGAGRATLRARRTAAMVSGGSKIMRVDGEIAIAQFGIAAPSRTHIHEHCDCRRYGSSFGDAGLATGAGPVFPRHPDPEGKLKVRTKTTNTATVKRPNATLAFGCRQPMAAILSLGLSTLNLPGFGNSAMRSGTGAFAESVTVGSYGSAAISPANRAVAASLGMRAKRAASCQGSKSERASIESMLTLSPFLSSLITA